MWARHAEANVRAALEDTRVVFLAGPRQCGKSTLAQALGASLGGRYLTLDDAAVFDQARADPMAFVAQARDERLIIDEAQRLPELFNAIKRDVDADPRPGRFLLTGSANFLALPRVSESLAGRVEVVPLATLSQGEIGGGREGFIDALFDGPDPALGPSDLNRDGYLRRAVTGGYPEVVGRAGPGRRARWFGSYLTTLIQRDLRDIAAIDHTAAIPGLLRLLAARTAGLANVLDLSRDAGLANTTLSRYLAILEALYLLEPLRPWSANLTTRLARSPKLYLSDSGLTAYLTGATEERAARQPEIAGPLLEAFVLGEVRRQASWNEGQPSVWFLRTQKGDGVDIVLEQRDGRVAGIEVKSAARLDRHDTRGLAFLRDRLGERFARGVVLYSGQQTLPAGDRLWAMPIDALWRWGAVQIPHAVGEI
jgi:predicted AAA+ superfamily ATPase